MAPQRDPVGQGMLWASRITTLGLEFALPIGAGAWADQRWRCSPALLMVGLVLGAAVGTLHLTQIARELSGPPRQPRA